MMAENTMDAIKKKMQAMRLEKETAFDRADQLEQRLTEQKYIYDKVAISSVAACVVAITADCCFFYSSYIPQRYRASAVITPFKVIHGHRF